MAGRKIGEIYGEIKIKNQQFNTGLKQSQTKLQGFKMKSVAIFAAITAASYVLIRGLKDIITVASNLEEQTAKFGTVFRGVMDNANESVKTLTDSYGMSTREARELMAGIQDLLVPMGMMRDEAAGFSFEIVKLATDIGSFNNLPTAEAMEKIKSALVGMYRPMRSVGVVLSDMTVRQKALNMGLAKSDDEVTALHKAIAAYTLSLEMSKDAQGDFIRTSDGFANSMKILNAEIEELKSTIGTKLLPVIADWIGDFSELTKEVTKFLEKIGVLEKDTLPALIQKQWEYTQIIERRKHYMDEEDEGLIRYRKLLIEVEKQIKAILDKRREEIVSIEVVTDKTEEYMESLKKLGPYLYEVKNAVERNKLAYEELGFSIKSTREVWGPTLKEMKGGTDQTADATDILGHKLTEMGGTAVQAFMQGADMADIMGDAIKRMIVQLTTAIVQAKILQGLGIGGDGDGDGGGGFWGFLSDVAHLGARVAAAYITGGTSEAGYAISGQTFMAQKGGFIPSQLIPQVSSGFVDRPSVLVGEGKGGELVIPEDKLKDMVQVTIHNANPHTYADVYINLPASVHQNIYKKAIKPAMKREGVR